MATAVKDMDSFVPLLMTTDTKQKLSVGQELLAYIQGGAPIECSDIGVVIDSIIPWIHSSNFKVSQMGIELATELAARMGCYFKPYIPSILPPVIDRLGDSKELVRERCQMLLQQLLDSGALNPQQLLERLSPAFSHKNSNVREEVLLTLNTTLNQHGAAHVTVSKFTPSIVKLLSDPAAHVRDAAAASLTNIYRHVGDRLRNDLIKRGSVPPNKLQSLVVKFDEIKAAGDLLPTASSSASSNHPDEDEVDRATLKKTSSLPKKAVLQSTKSLQTTPVSSSANQSTLKILLAKNRTTGPAGALDEESFIRAFKDVPSAQIFSPRDLEESLHNIQQVISEPSNDWNKRVDALRKIRSLVVAGALQYEEFFNYLRLFDPSFQISIKDLRSQVVREVCYTIAFLSQQIGNKLDHLAESLVPVLFNLIQNSAKVIASCGQVCIGFIVTHTHSSRLVPLIVAPLSHKSRDIRRAAARFLHQVLSNWSFHFLAKHAQLLQQSLQTAIPDADQEVRMVARKAFWAFKSHFPDHADTLLNSLDATYKRSLHSDMSNSSSSNSLNQIQSTRSKIPESTPVRRTFPPVATSPRSPSARSNSAIDLQAVQRAKARSQYAAMARQKVGSNASLPRPKKVGCDSGPSSLVSSILSPERNSRQRTRSAKGVSQSQPSSRSGSPSSRLNYATYGLGERSKRSPSYSRSNTGSRETSPSRYSPLPPLSKLRGRPSVERNCLQPTKPPVLAQKFLQQSIEAESALADALTYETPGFSATRRLRDEHSDDSETSSQCSERSFESYRRTSDSFSWSGSQQRIYRDIWDGTIKDINEILMACESIHWSDRKEGLVSLSVYLQEGNLLTQSQLNRVTDNFTKMLSDSHTKVFSLFLDTVNELLATHHSDLHGWLYILLTRLFHKLGGDLLGSIQSKIHKTLQTVRDNFGSESMLHWALRFLVDATQTPNMKVKLSVLQFIAKLAPTADPSIAFPPPTPGKPAGSSRDVTTAALNKMIGWTMGDCINKSSELRRASQEAILALFNLNTPQVTLRFSQLPKEYQEAAASLIQGRVRRTSSSSESPSKHQEALSPDQVYKSLKKTTAEIQNYSYDGKVVDATSHDSGISQMSALDSKIDLETISNWTSTLSLSPTSATEVNGVTSSGATSSGATDTVDNGLSISSDGADDGTLIVKLMDSIEGKSGESWNKDNDLKQLAEVIKDADASLIQPHFRRLLRIIIPVINEVSSKGNGKEYAFNMLSDMVRKPSLSDKFETYVELILLKVIQAYADPKKELFKASEICARSIAVMLQSQLVLKVLTPIISTHDFPLNLAAIKTLTLMVESREADEVQPFIPQIMPGLVQAYASEQSLVRKATVFCMVALHNKFGPDPLKPFLATLNASKLKLLHLYINRTQNGASSSKSSSQDAP